MPALVITKSYEDGQILNESDLDNIKDDVETFLNVTKLDADNLQLDTITAGFTATQANNVLDATSSAHSMPAAAADKVGTQMTSTGANAIFNTATSAHTMAALTARRVIDQSSRTFVVGTTAVALGEVGVSASSESFVDTPASLTDVTNLSLSITTSGRPVFVGLQSDGNRAYIQVSSESAGTSNDDNPETDIFIDRDGSVRSTMQLELRDTAVSVGTDTLRLNTPPGYIWHLDNVSAGTHTYKIQVKNSGLNNTQVSVVNCRLLAYELS